MPNGLMKKVEPLTIIDPLPFELTAPITINSEIKLEKDEWNGIIQSTSLKESVITRFHSVI